MYVHTAYGIIKRAYQRRASVIRYLGRSGRRGLGVDVIIVIASGRHVAGGVRRHVAASVLQQVVTATDSARRRRRLPHTPYGRVRAVCTGYRPDTYQHVGVGHVRGARVTGAENIREWRVIDGLCDASLRALSGNGVLHTPPPPHSADILSRGGGKTITMTCYGFAGNLRTPKRGPVLLDETLETVPRRSPRKMDRKKFTRNV